MAKAAKSKASKPAKAAARTAARAKPKSKPKAKKAVSATAARRVAPSRAARPKAAKPPSPKARPAPAKKPAARKSAPPRVHAPLRTRVADLAALEPKPTPQGGVREAVASFATEAQFRGAVKRLLAAGFAPTDLSILTSHDSLEVAGQVPGYRAKPGQSLLAGLTEEAGLLQPLQVAGFSALSGGPVAAAIAGLLTVGIGALGLGDVIEKFAANRHRADYEAALRAGGVLLWVKVTPEQEWKALMILGDSGGANAHINWRAGV